MRALGRAAGVIFILVGVWVAAEAAALGVGAALRPGPGFFPIAIGAAMAGLGATLALSRTPDVAGTPEGDGHGRGAGKTLGGMGLLAAYGLALERLGFVLTTVLLILVWLRGLEGSRWREAITLAVAATVAVYGIFVRWLQVPVPMGVLGR